jgi:tetratricopeptide (TPR) repeat protein
VHDSSPQAARQQLEAIWRAWKSGDARSAVAACQAMNLNFPEDADGWHASSVIALQLGGAAPALLFIEKALDIRPGEAAWRVHRARCLHATGDGAGATVILEELCKAATGNPELLAETALLAGALNRHELAESLFGEAAGLDPGNARLHYNVAATQRYLGKLEDALDSVNRAIELNPRDPDAHYLRASLRRWTVKSNHVDALERALDGTVNNALGEAQLCYALAKELEDCAEYAASFSYLQRGAKTRRRKLQYDIGEDLAFFRALREVYDREFLQERAAGTHSRDPIFVLGLPRTGTTLVERILSACDGVTSIGESTVLTQLIGAAAQRLNPSPRVTRADLVRATTGINFKELGDAYLQRARPAGGNAIRFVDKFPQNTLNIGAIHKALPEAAIVLLERHPMDACYAMYKALFTDIYAFSYEFGELARYFIAHQGLMRHWREALPGRVHVLRYENLVSDPEGEARKLLAHCGLDWQADCLDFTRNPQASTTASASQIRQGIYSSSVGLWKHYAEQLAPLERSLREAGCLDGWPD